MTLRNQSFFFFTWEIKRRPKRGKINLMVYHWSNRQVNTIRVYYEINTTTNSMQLKWKFRRDKRKMHMYYLMPAYLSLYVTHSSIITSNFKSFCQQFEQFMKLSSVCVCFVSCCDRIMRWFKYDWMMEMMTGSQFSVDTLDFNTEMEFF